MKTWDNYKEYVKSADESSAEMIEETESIAKIVGAMIEQRNSMGLSQRDLAKLCDLPQSSVARIESCRTTPNLMTLMKICKPLGLKLAILPNE